MNRLELGYLPIIVNDWKKREYHVAEVATVRLSDNTALEGVAVIGTRNDECWKLVYVENLPKSGLVSSENLRSVSLERVTGYNPNIESHAPCGN